MNYAAWTGTPTDNNGLTSLASSARSRAQHAQQFLDSSPAADNDGTSLAGFQTFNGASNALTGLPMQNAEIETAFAGAGINAAGQIMQAGQRAKMYAAAAKAEGQSGQAAQKKQKSGILGTIGSIAGGLIGGAVGGPAGALAGKTIGGGLGGMIG
jgi:hypothetical protein